jgi:hypothetical protein
MDYETLLTQLTNTFSRLQEYKRGLQSTYFTRRSLQFCTLRWPCRSCIEDTKPIALHWIQILTRECEPIKSDLLSKCIAPVYQFTNFRFTNFRYNEPCKFIPIFQFTNIIFAATSHVNLYHFSIYEHYFRYNEPCKFIPIFQFTNIIFATTNHVNLYLFFNLRTLISLQRAM